MGLHLPAEARCLTYAPALEQDGAWFRQFGQDVSRLGVLVGLVHDNPVPPSKRFPLQAAA